jgi:alpha-tubulin suppressor-like RCC1 family protein
MNRKFFVFASSIFIVTVCSAQFPLQRPKTAGTVVAWGERNEAGQANVPAGLAQVVQVAAGGSFSVALKNDGTVVAWGSNQLGQLNIPSELTNVVQISTYGYHILALRSDGTVVAWGFINPAI